MSELEHIRSKKGLTQEAVAKQVGVAISTYSMYENGLRSIPKHTAEKIAEVLGCGTEDIFLPEKFTVSKR